MTATDSHILKHFENTFSTEGPRRVAEAVRGLAYHMASTLPPNGERREGLRRLLEARDYFLRAQATAADATVTISKTTFDRLEAAAEWLNCLEAAGLDNWDGCAEAAQIRQDLEGGKRRE